MQTSPTLRRYPEALQQFRWSALWELFDGDRGRLNIAHECVDRHPGEATALRLATADGGHREVSFAALRAWSSRFAHFLAAEGIGARRAGGHHARAVPGLLRRALRHAQARGHRRPSLHPLRPRGPRPAPRTTAAPRLLLVARDPERWQPLFPDVRVIAVDEDFEARLAREAGRLRAGDGRRRPGGLPVHVGHDARAARGRAPHASLGGDAHGGRPLRRGPRARRPLLLPVVARVGPRALARDDRPARPRHRGGRLRRKVRRRAPARRAGRPSRSRNLAAAPTVFRLLRRRRGRPAAIAWPCARSRSPASPWTGARGTSSSAPSGSRRAACTAAPRSGVIIANYPGFAGYEVRRGALGKAAPGWEVAVVDADGPAAAPGTDRGDRRAAEGRLVPREGPRAHGRRTATSTSTAAPTTSSSRRAGP